MYSGNNIRNANIGLATTRLQRISVHTIMSINVKTVKCTIFIDSRDKRILILKRTGVYLLHGRLCFNVAVFLIEKLCTPCTLVIEMCPKKNRTRNTYLLFRSRSDGMLLIRVYISRVCLNKSAAFDRCVGVHQQTGRSEWIVRLFKIYFLLAIVFSKIISKFRLFSIFL